MRRLLWVLMIGLVPVMAPILAGAAERPDWAFPVTDKVQPPLPPDEQPHTVPGSDKSYTRKQIDDLFNPPDWYPDLHPPMPQIVAHGEGAAVRACASCHLPTGTGHDESAYIAALPVGYFVHEMVDYKSGARKGSGSMTAIAQAISEADVHAAADYFASLKPRPWIRVVETDTVPKTYVGPGNKRLRLPGGETEPIGNRIIEIPEDEAVVLNRDPRSGFVAFVPKGSIAKGQAIVATGADKTVPCGICHGPTLKGLGEVPPIAGRQANYVVRQLFSIQDGSRGGVSSALMQQVVERLTLDDMLAIAAYTASRQP
ncbi:MAG TPA: cytochrome C [Xanthobacteraceae bacterium]|nr:cytochrome C [Xanthobacteraceae bacterium]